MDAHRLVAPTSCRPESTDPPFSCFSFVNDHFGGIRSLHRCFSLARSAGFRTLTVEDIPAMGIVEEENGELTAAFSDYENPDLKRLAFWDVENDGTDLSSLTDAALIGYAILKRDRIASAAVDAWHVFEAVFRKYDHRHNCLPCPQKYRLRVGDAEFTIAGLLYCQQNSLNKSCAHVAARSLLTRCLPEGDIPYSEMNRLARDISGGSYRPAEGLSVEHIRRILEEKNVSFRDIDYTTQCRHCTIPFQKYLYSGIESGCGGLLGFRITGPRAQDGTAHMIPFFGHTFNKDTWAPDADIAYFDVGGGLGYIPSESWTSSFLGHDDNFGPNFCVPRLYVRPEQADYVVELLRDGVCYGGVQAETMALPFLYSLYPRLIEDGTDGLWLERLATLAAPKVQRAILRTVSVAKETYLRHLANATDWEGHNELEGVVQILDRLLPDDLWVAEVSVPELFPANERKVADILLDPRVPYDEQNPVNFDAFLLARVPGHYFLVDSSEGAMPTFLEIPSLLDSHVAVLGI